MMKKTISILSIVPLFFVLAYPVNAQEITFPTPWSPESQEPIPYSPYNKNIHYEFAVPSLVRALMAVGRTIADPLQIGVWYEAVKARFPEFLDDMIALTEEESHQEFGQFDPAPFVEFGDKWIRAIEEYPGLDEVKPLVIPILENLLTGLTVPRKQRPGEDPLTNLYEWYIWNFLDSPWGFREVFRLEPLPEEGVEEIVREISSEVTEAGYKKERVHWRKTTVLKNGTVIFYQIIVDDEIVYEFNSEPNDRTFLHAVLREMMQNNEDPELIAALQEFVNLIDYYIDEAAQNGGLILPT